MGILILLIVVAVLVLGLERNARLTRRQPPSRSAGSAWPASADRRDRDAERLLDELRARG
ncbi:hypothetical protein ABH931_005934 [Streptacidiphilus sp. MAP12-33]|uniref:hypothetical protein n=1 Tax=Streptacidiphilus sp. MAP12-33 TaxID=3156266 RepID=UPI0035150F03